MTKPVPPFNLEASLKLWNLANLYNLTKKNLAEMIKEGADINFTHPDNHYNSVFMLVCHSNDIDLIVDFIDRGADINYKNIGGYTASHWLLTRAFTEHIEVLVHHPINWKIKNNLKKDAIQEALSQGKIENVSVLLTKLPFNYFNLTDLKNYKKELVGWNQRSSEYLLENIDARTQKIMLEKKLSKSSSTTKAPGELLKI